MATNGVMSGARTEYEMPKIRTNKWSVYWNQRVKKMLPWTLKLKLGSIQMLSVPSRAGNSHDYGKVYHRFQKAPSNFSGLRGVFQKLRLHDRLVCTMSQKATFSFFFSGLLWTPLNELISTQKKTNQQVNQALDTHHTIVQHVRWSPGCLVFSGSVTKPLPFDRDDNQIHNSKQLQWKACKWSQHDVANEKSGLCRQGICQEARDLLWFSEYSFKFRQRCWPGRQE